MPPRKSDAAKAAPAAAPASDPASSDDDKPRRSRTSVDDNTLPKSIVTRLAKGNVPSNTQIQKDAVTALSRSATVFINYLASMANDITKMNSRKTITPENVIQAIDDIEFPGLKERLQGELEAFKKAQANKRKKAKDKKSDEATADPMSEDESARPVKRQRKTLANQKDDEDEGGVTEGNILEDGSQEEEEEEAAEEDEGSGEESGEGESGDEEPEDGMEDTVEDIDRDDNMEQDDEDEALDDGSDSD
ncbi:hypothetical protein TWF718_000738 [Orbilia javanica]|uniref:DNA polymerase epsilon subunit D n=1 Tax=Orbilia javanica TaxID=47235 RepID=A0AAN8MUD4_9PEZI